VSGPRQCFFMQIRNSTITLEKRNYSATFMIGASCFLETVVQRNYGTFWGCDQQRFLGCTYM